ncbi:MAG: YchF-related putative GTPase [Candidatus Aenigmatarchaeota archaeon]
MIELALAGCPSSGKSTFFKACTLKDVKIAPYPFTTTSPTEGVGHVTAKCPCAEFGLKCNKCIDGTRLVPIKLWDIVGLVPDAHLGRGRGVAFLDDIRQAQGLIHIIDASGKTDLEGNATTGFDPTEAVRMLERELAWWMLGILKRGIALAPKGKPEPLTQIAAKQFTGLGIKAAQIERAVAECSLDVSAYRAWSDDKLFAFVDQLRAISKPAVIAANKFDLPEAQANLERLKRAYPDRIIVPTSGDLELALREAAAAGIIKYIPGASSIQILQPEKLSSKQKSALDYIQAFLKKNGGTGVQAALNAAAFKLLDLIVVYPVADPHKLTDKNGNILPDAFLIKRDSTARDLAFAVHEEIGKKFISAVNARTGQNIAADQPLKDGDIISIRAGR